ncbi:hypothetical protein DUI87_27735 [Hirundo rustica rustica]|uniref:Uncharacterized protein n=1 Tax=Hirundo rustica rustica TaxID=333673 RepID=A0A3M0J9Q6_HIRRU|nr:hypothetical protein DUI87_27735 [Hirundo rustica rustica]
MMLGPPEQPVQAEGSGRIKKPRNILQKSTGADFICDLSNAAKLNAVVWKQPHSMTGLEVFTPSDGQGVNTFIRNLNHLTEADREMSLWCNSEHGRGEAPAAERRELLEEPGEIRPKVTNSELVVKITVISNIGNGVLTTGILGVTLGEESQIPALNTVMAFGMPCPSILLPP